MIPNILRLVLMSGEPLWRFVRI